MLARAGRSTALLGLALVFGVSLLVGCVGRVPETRYYLLSEPQDAAAPVAESSTADPTSGGPSGGAQPLLRLLSVRVPDYLQTRGLVVALEDSRIQPAVYHQWAEPLAAGLERYLGAALDAATAGGAVSGPPALLTITLSHLHGSEAGTVVLDAQWELLAAEDRSVLDRGRFERLLDQGEPGYMALVATHRRLLDALAGAIVAQWRSASAIARTAAGTAALVADR